MMMFTNSGLVLPFALVAFFTLTLALAESKGPRNAHDQNQDKNDRQQVNKHRCGKNEEWGCESRGCPRTCQFLGKIIREGPQICTLDCQMGCHCKKGQDPRDPKSGYWRRASDGQCVKGKQCLRRHGDQESNHGDQQKNLKSPQSGDKEEHSIDDDKDQEGDIGRLRGTKEEHERQNERERERERRERIRERERRERQRKREEREREREQERERDQNQNKDQNKQDKNDHHHQESKDHEHHHDKDDQGDDKEQHKCNGQNEEWGCESSSCPRTCEQYMKVLQHGPQICTQDCRLGCHCKTAKDPNPLSGFWRRESDGKCVKGHACNPKPKCERKGQQCGGIVGLVCCKGLQCVGQDPNIPDSAGRCEKRDHHCTPIGEACIPFTENKCCDHLVCRPIVAKGPIRGKCLKPQTDCIPLNGLCGGGIERSCCPNSECSANKGGRGRCTPINKQ